MPYSLQNPQSLEEFLAKYSGALDSQGRFIPGKANLNYDDMKAEDVYKQLIGGAQTWDADGNSMGTQAPQSEVNADWIEDPRAKGWIGQHPTGALIAGTVLGGVGANMLGLLGAGGAGAAEAASLGGYGAGGASGTIGGSYVPSAAAFGGSTPAWMTGANAVGAGDLALASMPQVTAASLGAGAGGALGATAAMEAFPQVTITGAKGAASGAFGGAATPAWMSGANAVGAGDLAKVAMPQVTKSMVGGGMVDTATQWLKDNPTLAKLGGAALGALAGGDTTISASKDPWKPAQPYLMENLRRNSAMQDFYAKDPFSSEQKTAYQGLLNTLQNNQSNAGNMAGMANSFMGSNRGLLSGMPQFTQGTKAAPVDWSRYQNIGLMGG